MVTMTMAGNVVRSRPRSRRWRGLALLGAAVATVGAAVPALPAGAAGAPLPLTARRSPSIRHASPTRPRSTTRSCPRSGHQLVMVGTANRGQGQGAHRVVFTVTDIAKEIDGVRSLVVWDRDFQDGALVEAELSFWAQDDDGNVWNMGEYPEEWEDGELAGAPSTWLTGPSGPGPASTCWPTPCRRADLPAGQGAAHRLPGSGQGRRSPPADLRAGRLLPATCSSPTSGTRWTSPLTASAQVQRTRGRHREGRGGRRRRAGDARADQVRAPHRRRVRGGPGQGVQARRTGLRPSPGPSGPGTPPAQQLP